MYDTEGARKEMIKVMVMSKLLAEHIRLFDDDTLVISITSPGQREAEVKGKHVYKFQFHDVREDLMIDSGIMNAMTEEMADAIVEVVMNNRHLKRMVIHCEAGVSRSPGVAIGLGRYFDLSPGVTELVDKFPCHNKHVMKMMHRAMRKKITYIGWIDEQIDKSAAQGEEW